jgi:hypothetical protein
MAATSSDWNAERMLELATRHARLEGQKRLDDLMDTLIEEPVYEFPVQGLTLRGGASVRRYYQQFFDDYMSHVKGARLVSQWADGVAVAREDAIEVEGGDGPRLQRVMSVLFAVGDRLGGERIYASDSVVRMMAGAMFTELENIA